MRRKWAAELSVFRKCLLDKYLASLEVFLRKKKKWHEFMLMNVLLLIKSELV